MATVQPVGERPGWVDDELFPFESRFVELDGNVVHYVDEGPILLLLHSNPVWSFVYRDVITTLCDRFRCIALDFPGFGLSTAAPGYRFTAQEHSEVLLSFIERLDLAGMTLVGHGWGGPFGLYAAERQPERFDRLVLTNTWAWALNGDLSTEFFSRFGGSLVGRELVRRFDLMVEYFVPSAHKRRKVSDAEMKQYRQAMPTPARRQPCAVLPGELLGATRFLRDLEDGLESVHHMPTLILWGDSDWIFPEKYRKRWEAILPNYTTTVLKGVGHFPQSDAPAEFSEAIEAWWAGLADNNGPTDRVVSTPNQN